MNPLTEIAAVTPKGKKKKKPTKTHIHMVRKELHSFSYLPSFSEWIIDNVIQTK